MARNKITSKCKLTKQFIKDSYEWIKENGLQDYGGASLKDYWRAMHIDESGKTFYNWLGGGYELSSEYSDSIKQAKEEYKKNLSKDIVLSMARVAKGYEYTKEKKEMRGKIVTKKTTENIVVPPNVTAGIFLLTNLDPSNWQNRHNVEQKESKTIKIDADVDILENLPEDVLFGMADTIQSIAPKAKAKELEYIDAEELTDE